VENSIEETIKIIERKIKEAEHYSNITGLCLTLDEELRNALMNILSNYKKVLKENEELKFEERSRIIGKYGDVEIHDVINRTLSNDYIPVQKVKEKMEKDIKTNEHTILGGRRNGKTLEYGKRLGRIEMCQELLEGENKICMVY
jgi:hypothetical protein